ncbi:membrane lipoprotein lipid attachment site-containing protein [Enterovibrio norvegicus]|uniref:membrane lipoprotein lipid attachment site-containing protein n=1 Tax=Enterovibrio norvegicus TaxID=188144 RepID=UPI000C85ACC4|nr:membrane lipoprotein lipid attachment site-containing protein [Enterovibrio norvegicus]PMN73135.1 hypothetical protein BCT27_12380 [Enterovibrio norvegicus]
MKKIVFTAVVLAALAGCSRDAQVASSNLSKAADMFEIDRRVVFYNGITGDYMLTIEGKCSIEDSGHKVQVTCKTGSNSFKRHQLGLSDNVTYFAEHLTGTDVSVYHHRIVFKPQTIVPEIDLNIDGSELLNDRH